MKQFSSTPSRPRKTLTPFTPPGRTTYNPSPNVARQIKKLNNQGMKVQVSRAFILSFLTKNNNEKVDRHYMEFSSTTETIVQGFFDPCSIFFKE